MVVRVSFLNGWQQTGDGYALLVRTLMDTMKYINVAHTTTTAKKKKKEGKLKYAGKKKESKWHHRNRKIKTKNQNESSTLDMHFISLKWEIYDIWDFRIKQQTGH